MRGWPARGLVTALITGLLSLLAGGTVVAAPILYGAAHLGPNGMSTLHVIDPATGAATPVGPIGFRRVSGMDFHPFTGDLYATGFRATRDVHVLLRVDPATGEGTEIGPTRIGRICNPEGFGGFAPACGETATDVAFRHADGVLFGYIDAPAPCPAMRTIVTFDIATGVASFVGFTGGAGCRGDALGFTPDDELFFLSDVSLSTIDPATGAETLIAAPTYPPCGPAGIPRANALTFHPLTGAAHATMVATSVNCLITVDTATGVATLVGPTVAGLDALAWSSDVAAGPTIWLGVTNSDNNGRRVDLMVELYRSGELIARGGVVNAPVAGNALANARAFELPLVLRAPVEVASGDTLTSIVLVRRSGGSGDFAVRMWYGNAVPPPPTRRGWSHLEAVLDGVPGTLYYRGGACPAAPCDLPLDTAPGTAGVASVQTASPDVLPFGAWSFTVP
jgi:hypothetical protein